MSLAASQKKYRSLSNFHPRNNPTTAEPMQVDKTIAKDPESGRHAKESLHKGLDLKQ